MPQFDLNFTWGGGAPLDQHPARRALPSVGRLLVVLGTIAAFLCAVAPRFAQAQSKDKLAVARDKMVSIYLAQEGIKNPRVLDVMRQVPRHLFVPQAQRSGAYFDQALPIGHKQTISPPYIVAYMTEMLDPQRFWRDWSKKSTRLKS
ncbi:MAG: hypothetical protein NT069_19020 [Planctomycetota bacterium]|nr:hypothetical protein [Planctomycetota bacterium]